MGPIAMFRRVIVRALIVTLLMSGLAVSAAAPGRPCVYDLCVGDAVAHDVVFRMGEPVVVFLRADSEYGNKSRLDDLVFRYESSLDVGGERRVWVRFLIAARTQKLRSVDVQFVPTGHESKVVARSDIEAQYGPPERIAHRREILLEGEMEGTYSECDDPAGEVVVLIYRALGLEVWIHRDYPGVQRMAWSREVTERGFLPPCSKGEPVEGATR